MESRLSLDLILENGLGLDWSFFNMSKERRDFEGSEEIGVSFFFEVL